MKTIKKTMYLVMLFTAVLFTACSTNDDDDNDDDGSSGGSEFVTAKVNGTDFEAAQDPAVIVGATVSNGVLAVHGGKNNGETLRLTIGSYNGVGTYSAGESITSVNSLMYVTISPVAAWTTIFDLATGTIEITSDDGTTVEGTFSFEGYNAADQTTKTITVGKFKATLE